MILFGEKNSGITPGKLLAFVAEMFTKDNQVPLESYFPNIDLESIRLLRVVYQTNNGHKVVSLDFQIYWANLVLKATLTYDITTRQFGTFGGLFPENRVEQLPLAFNYIPYLPNYEPWTFIPRTSVGSAQCQAIEGVANLRDIYSQLTKAKEQEDGDTLTPGPFEMNLFQLTWSLEGSVVQFGAVVVCPAQDPNEKYSLPPIQFTAGRLDLKFDFKAPEDESKIREIAIFATFTFRPPPKEPRPKLRILNDAVVKSVDKYSEEDDPDNEAHICRCGIALEYADRTWTIAANVTGLSGSMLYSIFDDDCKHEVAELLKKVSLDLGIEYHYDNKGEGSWFLIGGALYIGSLELRCTYRHEGNRKWEFSADVALGTQKTTLLSLARSLFGIEPQELPTWIGDIQAESHAMHAAEASSLASLEILSTSDYVILLFRFRLSERSTVVFYQVQAKKKENEPERKKPKRVLMLSVPELPTPDPVPLIGTIKPPFEKLDFLWVLDGNADARGFTRTDLTVLNSAINQSQKSTLFPRLRYEDTIKKGNEKDSDVLLTPGFHFIVSSSEKVLLDYVFGKTNKTLQDKAASRRNDIVTQDTARTPINKKFGPITLLGLGLGFDLGTSTLSLALDGSLELGPLGFTVIGLELSFRFENGATLQNPRPIKPMVSLSGLGATFERDPVILAGLFERGMMPNGDVYYQGAASVGFAPYVFRAAGYYGENSENTKKEDRITQRELSLEDFNFILLEEKKKFQSFLVYCTLEGPLMTIGYAEIRGLTGGFGYNTSITMPTVDKVIDFPFLTVPKSNDTEGAQSQLMSSGWFKVQKGSYWAAAGLTLLAFQMLAVSAVVVVEWNPGIKLGLFGVATAEMPRQAKFKFARVQLALAATIDFDAGILRVDGQLTPASFILDPQCHLTGGFALYAWFGNGDPAMQGSWVFSIGGYHPRFIAPAQFPIPPRLGISWSFDKYINISGEAYFAITPKVCMGGGRLHVTLSLGSLYAYFNAYADFMIQYRPFHFETEGGLNVGVQYTLDLWLVSINIAIDIAARLYLEGPPIRGTVHVDFWVFGFDVNFGTKEIASKTDLSLSEFYDLVLQADTKQPASIPTLDFDCQEQAAETSLAPHILSCTSGIIADNARSAPAANDKWRVRGAIFAFTVSCKFVFDEYEVRTVVAGQPVHLHAPPCPGKGSIYARPMGLRNAMFSSKVTITVTRLQSPLDTATDDVEESAIPVWTEVKHSLASLPTALWGKGESLFPLSMSYS